MYREKYVAGYRFLAFDGTRLISFTRSLAEAYERLRGKRDQRVFKLGADGRITQYRESMRYGVKRNPEHDAGPLVSQRVGGKVYSRILLPDSRGIEAYWEVVPLEALVISNFVNGQKNKEYPSEYQPRDRRLPKYRDQHAAILTHFEPLQLAWSAVAQTGAPIVVPDGDFFIVASGNGRCMALAEMYQGGGIMSPIVLDKAQTLYYQSLRDWCKLLGLKLGNMVDPILVRVATEKELAKVGLNGPEFARAANTSAVFEYNATEQAIADAKRLEEYPQVVAQFDPFAVVSKDDNGETNLSSPKNAEFVGSFVKLIAGENAANDILVAKINETTLRTEYVLSKAGAQRILAAVFRYAYGDDVNILIPFFTEKEVKGISGVVNTLAQAAPWWLQVDNAIRRGTLSRDRDIRPDLVKAVLEYHAGLISGKASALSSSMAIADPSGQFSTPVSKLWLRAFYNAGASRIAPEAMLSVLGAYADIVLSDAWGVCPICDGTGKQKGHSCDACGGHGFHVHDDPKSKAKLNQVTFGFFDDKPQEKVSRKELPVYNMLAIAIAKALFEAPYMQTYKSTGKTAGKGMDTVSNEDLQQAIRTTPDVVIRSWPDGWVARTIQYLREIGKVDGTFEEAYTLARGMAHGGVKDWVEWRRVHKLPLPKIKTIPIPGTTNAVRYEIGW